MPGLTVETAGAGVSACRSPTHSELAAGSEGAVGLPSRRGASRSDLACLHGKYRDTSAPSPFYRLCRSCTRSLGQKIRDLSYRVAAPTFPRAKLSAGPKEGCSGERGSAEVVGGAGRPVLEWGREGTGWGRCRRGPGPGQGRAPSPGPVAIKKACPLPPGLKSLRVHDAPVSTEKSRERPLPRRRGVVGYSQGCSGSWGGLGGQRSTRTRSPKALAVASDPPLCYLASRSRRGLRHKEVVVEGDSKSLKGGIHFGHLGRERREKRRGKKGERQTGRAR